MKRIAILGLLGMSLMGGCKPFVDTVYLASQKYPARLVNHPIQIYTDSLPECEFQELAIVTAKPPNELVTLEVVTEWLRKAARKMGGDAIIRLQVGEIANTKLKRSSTSTVYSTGTTVTNSLTGTVIRFLKDDCRK